MIDRLGLMTRVLTCLVNVALGNQVKPDIQYILLLVWLSHIVPSSLMQQILQVQVWQNNFDEGLQGNWTANAALFYFANVEYESEIIWNIIRNKECTRYQTVTRWSTDRNKYSTNRISLMMCQALIWWTSCPRYIRDSLGAVHSLG